MWGWRARAGMTTFAMAQIEKHESLKYVVFMCISCSSKSGDVSVVLQICLRFPMKFNDFQLLLEFAIFHQKSELLPSSEPEPIVRPVGMISVSALSTNSGWH